MLQQTFLNLFSLHFTCFSPFFMTLPIKTVKLLELTLKGVENKISWYITYAEDGLFCAAGFSLCCSDA